MKTRCRCPASLVPRLLALACLALATPASGQMLPLRQAHTAGIGSMEGPIAAEVSPDGRDVYLASFLSSSVQHFRRHHPSGGLTWRATLFNGDDAAPDGLDGAIDLAVSPDGLHLYVVGLNNDSVTLFERNPTTGHPSYGITYTDPVALLDGASGVAVSADGSEVWVTALGAGAVLVYSRDAVTGVLSYLGGSSAPELDGARAVTLGADGRAYVAAHVADTLTVWDAQSPAGVVSLQTLRDGVGADGLDGAYAAALGPGEVDVYVAAFDDDAVSHFRRDPTSGDLQFVAARSSGAFLDAAAGVWASAEGSKLYATANGSQNLVVFERDPANGTLLPSTTIYPVTNPFLGGLAGATGLTGSPDGAHLYVAALLGRSLGVFEAHSESRTVDFVGAQRDTVPRAVGAGAGDEPVSIQMQETVAIAVSSNGRHVYSARAGTDAAVVLFQRTEEGVLTPRETFPAGAPGTPILALSPAGEHLYIGFDEDSSPDLLVSFTIHPSTGSLTQIDSLLDGGGAGEGLGGIAEIALSPDGAHLFAVGRDDDALLHFSRDGSTGLLTLVRAWTAAGDGLPLGAATTVEVSPAGDRVYVGASLAILTFELLPGGTLAHLDSLPYYLSLRIGEPTGMAISGDGTSLYVTGGLGSVGHFQLGAGGIPSAASGYLDGYDGIEVLAGAEDVVVNHAGDRVWVASSADHAVVAFARHSGGYLSFLGQSAGVTASARLTEPMALAPSPDGRQLYVASHGQYSFHGGVGVLETMLFGDGFETGGFSAWSAVFPPQQIPD